MVSALKVGGRRLHELARAGEEVERAPRPVHIETLDVEAFEPGPFPAARLLVVCRRAPTCARSPPTSARRSGARAPRAAPPPPRRVVHPRRGARPRCDRRRSRRRGGGAARGDARPRAGRRRRRAGPGGAPRRHVHGGRAAAGDGPFAVVDPDGELLAVYERHGPGVKPAVVVGRSWRMTRVMHVVTDLVGHTPPRRARS